MESSSLVTKQELLEINFAAAAARLSSQDDFAEDKKQPLVNIQEGVDNIRQNIFDHLCETIENVEEFKGESYDISD